MRHAAAKPVRRETASFRSTERSGLTIPSADTFAVSGGTRCLVREIQKASFPGGLASLASSLHINPMPTDSNNNAGAPRMSLSGGQRQVEEKLAVTRAQRLSLAVDIPSPILDLGRKLINRSADLDETPQPLPQPGQHKPWQPLEQPGSPLLQLPGEIRNRIYELATVVSFDGCRPPTGHTISAGLLLTCKQTYLETNAIAYGNAAIYAMQTMRLNFYIKIRESLLCKMDNIFLEDPRLSPRTDTKKYWAWGDGVYNPVQKRLCDVAFHPKTLIFYGNFIFQSDAQRCSWVVRFFHCALSIVTTLTTIHFVEAQGAVAETGNPKVTGTVFQLDWVDANMCPLLLKRSRCSVKTAVCDTGEFDFWVYITERAKVRKVGVHVHPSWYSFCRDWPGPSKKG